MQLKVKDIVLDITSGQTGVVICFHTYLEMGTVASVRFPIGTMWVPVGNLKLVKSA